MTILNKNVARLIIFLSVLAGGFLFTSMNSTEVKANPINEGLGWAMPVGKTTAATCFPDNPNLTYITVVLTSAENHSARPTGRIRLQNVAVPSSFVQATGVNQLDLGCIDPFAGIWVSVDQVSGYARWDTAVNFNGNTRNYNWCCGFKMLNPSSDRGKRLVYYIFLVPSSSSIKAIAPQPDNTIIYTTGATANVTLQSQSVRGLPGSSGTIIVNSFIWIRHLGGAGIPDCGGANSCFIQTGCFGTCGGPWSFGSTIPINLSNLPLGRYQWYGQMHENPRTYCPFACLSDTLPITAQFAWQHFEIKQSLPDLIVSANSFSPGSPIAGDDMDFNGTVKNQGTASAGASTTRIRLDINNNGSWNLTGTRATGSLAVNATENESWNSFWTATSGTHKYEICADSAGGVTESDETNNCITRTFTVDDPPANTIVLSGSSTCSTSGSAVSLSWVSTTSDSSYSVLRDGTVVDSSVSGTSWNSGVLAPGSTNSWRVRGNTSGVDSNTVSVTVAGCPDLVTTFINITGVLIDGNSIFFDSTVDNIGEENAGASNARFRLDIGNNGSYDLTLGTPAVPALSPTDAPFFVNSSNWTAVTGNHRVEVCADYLNAVTNEKSESNNCTTRIFSIGSAVPQPWIKTTKGSVGTFGQISMNPGTPPSGEDNASYLAIAFDLIENFESSRDWLLGTSAADSYDLNPSIFKSFDEYVAEYKPTNWTSANTLPCGGKRIYQAAATFSIISTTNLNNTCTQPTVFFINNQLEINRIDTLISRPFVFIVRNDVNVYPQSRRISGYIITGGKFETLPGSNQLTSNLGGQRDGGVIANGLELRRDLGSGNTQPSEQFNYNPRILWYLRNLLGSSITKFREVAP